MEENKKVTDKMLDRIKYFINAIENGEYEPASYEFTLKLHLPFQGESRALILNDVFTPSQK